MRLPHQDGTRPQSAPCPWERRWAGRSLAAALRARVCLQGVRDYSVPVGLESRLHVDLLVVGSVAVSEKGKIKDRNSGPRPAAGPPAGSVHPGDADGK